MIRKIVIPVRGDGKSENVFAHAAAVARRYNAHIKVTHCRARAEDMMPYGVPIPKSMRQLLLKQSQTVADQVEDSLKREVQALAEPLGVVFTDTNDPSQASASWVEEQGRQVDIIKRHGRLADLICVAKPDVDRNLGMNTLKVALFNTGRPVLMCPPSQSAPKVLGSRIAIAWNGSTEASRAVALSLNLIEGADEVIIVSSGPEVHGAGPEDLLEYLKERGIQSRIELFKAKRKIGRTLLDVAGGAQADLLVMGAYSDSHERETIFGGVTQTVVDSSTIPVVFVH